MLGLFAQTTSEFTSDFTTTTTSTEVDAGLLGLSIGVILVASLVIYLVTAFITAKIFQKAGRPMWAAFVPVYNMWVLFEISGKPGWWALISLIPYVGGIIYFVLYIIAMLELAKRFSRSAVFAVFGLILFPLVGYIILGFGSSQYNADAAVGGTPTPGVPPTSPQPPVDPGAPVAPSQQQQL